MTITLNGDSGITAPTYGGVVASEYHVPVTAFKNRIINGAMVIDQRNNGSSVTITNGNVTYTLDRWAVYVAGANVAVQRVAGPTGFKNALRATGATGVTQIAPAQKIESANSYDLVGQSVTLQATFVVSGGSVTPRVTLYYPNSVDNFSSNTQISTTSLGTISSGTTVTKTYTVSNLPSGVANGLYVEFAYDAVGSGITVDLTGVQLEKGSTATSFDYRPYGTELSLCQRYYEMSYDQGTVAGTATGNGAVNNFTQLNTSVVTGGGLNVRFSVTKRAVPTVTAYSTSGPSGKIREANGGSDVNATVDLTGMTGCRIYASYTAQAACNLIGQYTASAEL